MRSIPRFFRFVWSINNILKKKIGRKNWKESVERIHSLNQTAFDFLKEKQEDKVNNFFKENENRIRLTLHPTNSYYYDQAAFKLKIQVNRAYIVKELFNFNS